MSLLKGYRTYLCVALGAAAELTNWIMTTFPTMPVNTQQVLHAISVLALAGAAYFRSQATK